MIIRLATIEDKSAILKLYDEFSALLNAEDIPSKLGGEMFDEIIKRNDTYIFVAVDHDQIIGLVNFFKLPNIRHNSYRGHIEDFFVTKEVRSKGVGTKLFSFVKDFCKEENISVIKLDSGNELIAAHKFYEKNGGKSTERFFRFDIESI